MIEGKLSNGFEYKLEDDVLDDYEIFEKMCMIDNDPDNTSLIVEVFMDLLGADQYKALKGHLRTKSGRVSTVAMFAALHELLDTEEDLKNSEPSPE